MTVFHNKHIAVSQTGPDPDMVYLKLSFYLSSDFFLFDKEHLLS